MSCALEELISAHQSIISIHSHQQLIYCKNVTAKSPPLKPSPGAAEFRCVRTKKSFVHILSGDLNSILSCVHFPRAASCMQKNLIIWVPCDVIAFLDIRG